MGLEPKYHSKFKYFLKILCSHSEDAWNCLAPSKSSKFETIKILVLLAHFQIFTPNMASGDDEEYPNQSNSLAVLMFKIYCVVKVLIVLVAAADQDDLFFSLGGQRVYIRLELLVLFARAWFF